MKSSLQSRRSGRTAPIKGVRAAKAPRTANHASLPGYPVSKPDYQRCVCELELKLSALRAQVQEATIARVCAEEERQRYAEWYHSAPFGYLLLDERGNVVEYNERAASILALKPGHDMTGPFVRFVRREDILSFLNHLHQCARANRPVTTELEVRLPHGELLPVELSTAPNTSGDRQRMFRTALRDISERRQAEEALARRDRDFQLLVDGLPGLVCEIDAESLQMEFVSRASEQLLGYALEAWYQPGFWENHIQVDDCESSLIQVSKVVAERAAVVLEYRMLAADRRHVWLHHSLTVRERNGRLKLFGAAIDISSRKQVEEELTRAQQDLEHRVTERTARLRETVADLEAFSYSLSHDMRAPLRAMQGYAHLLNRAFADQLGSLGTEYLKRIMTGAERLDHLIQDVLTFSRVARAPLEPKTVDLDALVERVLAEYPALCAPEVDLQVDKPLLPVRGQEVFLSQCVSNLLTNAIKFTRPGEKPCVRVSTRPTAAGVRLYIEDRGIGIAPEDQQRIFGIFQRVYSHEQFEGTGIGLAIVQKAVERMGGHVGVESVPGQGSKFWLLLPGPEA